MDWSNLELVWRDGNVTPDNVIDKVREEIRTDLSDLGTPSDLVFHTVFLEGGDYETQPCVVISGFDDREDAFDAAYYR